MWIKICGLTSIDEAIEAAELGAHAIGLNFYPPSPRYVAREQAQSLLSALPARVATIGVVVLNQVVTLSDLPTGLSGVQTYSPEPVDPSPFPQHIPAYRVKESRDLDQIIRDLQSMIDQGRQPMAVLVDGYQPGSWGGTGQRAPWHLLRGFRPQVPLILAGGLTPDNVAEAIETVQPWGVDVAGGVESAPGRKDRIKVRDFIQAAIQTNLHNSAS